MTTLHTAQPQLFATPEALPQGLRFEPEVISRDEESALLAVISRLPLQAARYYQYTARRRVYVYGSRFDDDKVRTRPGPVGEPELPAPLQALRERLAAWSGIAASAFAHVMVAEYQPGTPLGWHRDAPHHESIVGVSLGNTARLRFRPWPPRPSDKASVLALELAPRSAYLISGAARWGWQHGIPPVPALRHSVTMRSARSATARERDPCRPSQPAGRASATTPSRPNRPQP